MINLLKLCRCLHALPVIVGALVSYRILQVPSCLIDYCRSLCTLPIIVEAFVPYRLTVGALCPNGLVGFFGTFQIKYNRSCLHMLSKYYAYSLSYLTHCLVIFSLQIQIDQVPRLPCKFSLHPSNGELGSLLTRGLSLGGGAVHSHLGASCVIFFLSWLILLYHMSQLVGRQPIILSTF